MSKRTASLRDHVAAQSVAAPPVSIPACAAIVATPKLSPVIIAAPGTDIDTITKAAVLDRPGIYVGLWYSGEAPFAYVGQSGTSIARRLADAKFRCPPADILIGITDADARLSHAETRALERLMHLQLIDAGYTVHGTVPAGAVVPPEPYALLRSYFGEVCLSLKLSQVLSFRDLPDARLLGGPVCDPGVILHEVPPGPRFMLDTPLGAAEMVESGMSFVVLPGSPARCDGVPAGKAVGVVAQELAHAGVLIPVVDDWYSVTKPIRFSSSSAAARLVTGAVAGSPDQWQGTTPGGPSRPTRVSIGKVPANVSRRVAGPYLSTDVTQIEEGLHV